MLAALKNRRTPFGQPWQEMCPTSAHGRSLGRLRRHIANISARLARPKATRSFTCIHAPGWNADPTSVDAEVPIIVGSGDRVEDPACGAVPIGSALGGLGVELPVGLLWGVAASDEYADGLIDV